MGATEEEKWKVRVKDKAWQPKTVEEKAKEGLREPAKHQEQKPVPVLA